MGYFQSRLGRAIVFVDRLGFFWSMSVMAIFRLTSARVFFDRRRPGYFSVDVG